MVVNFQSWPDPLIILMALPGALAGIYSMLFSTGTTISVPARTGAIMRIGVALQQYPLGYVRQRFAPRRP